MSSYIVIKKTETQTASINLCDDGLVRVMLKKKSEIDVPQAQENINAYIQITDNKKYAFLIYAEDDSVVYTEEARRHAKLQEDTFLKSCMAIMVKTLAHKLVANFYLNFYKPNFPFKVFNKMNDAEAWCLEQNQKQRKDSVNNASVLI